MQPREFQSSDQAISPKNIKQHKEDMTLCIYLKNQLILCAFDHHLKMKSQMVLKEHCKITIYDVPLP